MALVERKPSRRSLPGFDEKREKRKEKKFARYSLPRYFSKKRIQIFTVYNG